MRALLQRVSSASVTVDGQIIAEIGTGLLVFVGIENADAAEDAEWLASKIANIRVFNDADGVMNLSIKETSGEIIVVSQFTLHALTKKGNRPSYIVAARPEHAIPLYEQFVQQLEILVEKKVQTGKFGANMKVALLNDGPVTIFIDSKKRE